MILRVNRELCFLVKNDPTDNFLPIPTLMRQRNLFTNKNNNLCLTNGSEYGISNSVRKKYTSPLVCVALA